MRRLSRSSPRLLIKKGLVREMRAKPGMPIWRSDEEGRALALIILSAPRRASLPPIRAICGSTDCTASGSVRRFQTEAKSPTTFMRYADPIQTRRVSGLTGSTPKLCPAGRSQHIFGY